MSDINLRKIINFIAFNAVILCAISIVVGKWVPAFNEIASILALVVTAICAFFYVKAKRNTAFMVIYVISVALIIIFKMITIF